MDTTQMWVVVQLNAQPVAFPATLIKEVVPWQPLNPVPSKALGVMGLINLRGETLAVMDVLTMSGLGCIAQPSWVGRNTHARRLHNLLASDDTASELRHYSGNDVRNRNCEHK